MFVLYFFCIFGLYNNYNMSKPTLIKVKESVKELKALQRKHGELIRKRLQLLITIKQREKDPLSKRDLSTITGINHNTIVKWRKIYNQQGIAPLLKHGRVGGFKPSVVTKAEHKKLEALLNNPKNNISGYKELLDWVKTELSKDMLYITLVKYAERHFKTKIKVARKSHVNKDELKVETFKKTLRKNV